MYGWRARIGVITPSRGDTFACEFYKVVPDGVVLVSTILNVERLEGEFFERAIAEIKNAARLLKEEYVDVVMAAGTPVLTYRGMDHYEELLKEVREIVGVPVSTDLEASIEALKFVGAERIVFVSPYEEALMRREVDLLEQFGLQVVHSVGLGIRKNADITMQPFYLTYRLAREAYRQASNADAIFITCPRWATLVNIQMLEQDLGVPVVSTSSAKIWKMLRMAGIKCESKGYGKLLESLAK